MFKNKFGKYIDYIINGDDKEYQKIVPYLQKNNIFYKKKTKNVRDLIPSKDISVKDTVTVNDTVIVPEIINPVAEKTKTEKIKKPKPYKHPDYFQKFHFASSFLIQLTQNYSLKNAFTASGYKITETDRSIFPNFEFAYSVTKNIRPYISYLPYAEFYYRSQSNTPAGSLHISIIDEVSSFSVGTYYIWKPTDNLFLHRYEIYASGGLKLFNHKYSSNIWRSSDDPDYNIDWMWIDKEFGLSGLNFTGGASYFISKSFAATACVSLDITDSKMINEHSVSFANGTTATLNKYKFNMSALYFTIGLQVHL